MAGEWKQTTCAFCTVCCGLEMKVEDNHIIDVRPDPNNRRSRNYCCRKGRSARFYQENPDRLRHPLKRVGDEFVEISWDQAMSEIASKTQQLLDKYGPSSLTTIGGAGANAFGPAVYQAALTGELGITNSFNPTGCEFMCYFWANGNLTGRQARFLEPDEERMEALVLWGSNAYVSHMMINARRNIREISESPDRKLIVIDPRLSETARMADIHIPLRAGTDALMLRAMIALIVKEGWHKQDYLDRYVKDFDRVKPWFDGFDIEDACRVIQVPYQQLYDLCKVLTGCRWGVHPDLGIFMGRHNTMSCTLLNILMCVCGVMLEPGGNVVQKTIINVPDSDWNDPKTRRLRATGFRPVSSVYPAGCFAPEVLTDDPERIRGAFCLMSNPVRSFPDSNMVAKALERLDLLVVDDIVFNETAEYADYVLPAKSVYESYDFSPFMWEYPDTHVFVKRPVIEPEGDLRETGEFYLDLADAMGLIPPIPKSLYDAADRAAATGDRMKYLRALIGYVIRHPKNFDKLVYIVGRTLGRSMGSPQLASYWAALLLATDDMLKASCARAGYKPRGVFSGLARIPGLNALAGIDIMDQVFQAVYEDPDGALFARADVYNEHDNVLYPDKLMRLYSEEMNDYLHYITPESERDALDGNGQFPFALSAGIHKDGGHNGWMRNPETYQYRNPWTMEINADDAAELGLHDGGKARLITKTAEAVVDVECSYETSRGYVTIPHHYGFTTAGRTDGIGANLFTGSDELDPVTGDPVWRFIPCRVEANKMQCSGTHSHACVALAQPGCRVTVARCG